MSDNKDQPGFSKDGIASPEPGPEIDDDRRRFLQGALIAGGSAVAAPGLIGAAEAQTSAAAAAGEGRKNHYFVPATDKTVHWGYFSKSLKAAGRDRFRRLRHDRSADASFL